MNEINWLSHGGPGSGWFARDGHVPGSLGGKFFRRKNKKLYGTFTDEDREKYKKATEDLKTYNAYKSAVAKKKELDDAKKTSKAKSFNKASEDVEAYNRYVKAVNEAKDLNSKTSADLAKASGHFKGASSTIDNVSNGISKAWDNLHNAKYGHEDRSKDVSNLTNAELRQAIERIKLNQEYNKITMPSKTKGYDRTMAALAVLGSMATVTATGLSIAAGVKSLRKK